MDGWVGVVPSEEAGEQIIGHLRAGLREHGRKDVPFDIVLSLPVAVTSDVAARWEQMGATGLIVRPWAGRLADDLRGLAAAQTTDLDRKAAAARAFGAEVIGMRRNAMPSALS